MKSSRTFRDIFGDLYGDYYEGDIYISARDVGEITSLEGAPRVVTGYFDCDRTSIESLEGAPIYVGGYFSCEHTPNLISLEGFPKYCGQAVWLDEHHLREENLYIIIASQIRGRYLYPYYGSGFFQKGALKLLVRYFTEE